jgi:hypothetical protein
VIPHIPEHWWAVYGVGERDPWPIPGDIIIVRGDGIVSRLIRFVTRGEFNHCATVVEGGPNALVSQEAGKGDELTPLSAFDSVPYATLHIQGPEDQRDNCVAFANKIVGSGYGFLTIVADLFNAIFRVELDFGVSGRMVCSTAATRALERFGYIPKKNPSAMTPQDIADDFQIRL